MLQISSLLSLVSALEHVPPTKVIITSTCQAQHRASRKMNGVDQPSRLTGIIISHSGLNGTRMQRECFHVRILAMDVLGEAIERMFREYVRRREGDSDLCTNGRHRDEIAFGLCQHGESKTVVSEVSSTYSKPKT